MKPSEMAKNAGFKNFKELVAISGESMQNLSNWHRKRPLRFELILKGSMIKKMESMNNEQQKR